MKYVTPSGDITDERSSVSPLPCPYCGVLLEKDDVEWEEHPSEAIVAVACPNCQMTGPDMPSDEEAILAWNTLPRG